MPNETYSVNVECSNCDHVGPLDIPKGTLVADKMECPNCGCETAKKHEPVVNMPLNPWPAPDHRPNPIFHPPINPSPLIKDDDGLSSPYEVTMARLWPKPVPFREYERTR